MHAVWPPERGLLLSESLETSCTATAVAIAVLTTLHKHACTHTLRTHTHARMNAKASIPVIRKNNIFM